MSRKNPLIAEARKSLFFSSLVFMTGYNFRALKKFYNLEVRSLFLSEMIAKLERTQVAPP